MITLSAPHPLCTLRLWPSVGQPSASEAPSAVPGLHSIQCLNNRKAHTMAAQDHAACALQPSALQEMWMSSLSSCSCRGKAPDETDGKHGNCPRSSRPADLQTLLVLDAAAPAGCSYMLAIWPQATHSVFVILFILLMRQHVGARLALLSLTLPNLDCSLKHAQPFLLFT